MNSHHCCNNCCTSLMCSSCTCQRIQKEWISVETKLPELKSYAICLVDHQEDRWSAYFRKQRNQPRYESKQMMLRRIDSEGYAEWCEYETSSGMPAGSLYGKVTHWQPLPAVPVGDWT